MNWNLSAPYLFLFSRIRVKERLSRDETVKRPPDWSPNRHHTNKHKIHDNSGQYMQQRSERIRERTVHPVHGHAPCTPSASEYKHPEPGRTVDTQPYLAISDPVATVNLPELPEVQPRRRVSADQIYTTNMEARLEARQAVKEEAHTEGLLKSRKAVLPSDIRRKERGIKGTHRGHREDMEWQTYIPEQNRKRSQKEEDWDQDSQRERERERTVEWIRGSHDSQDKRVFRSVQPSHTTGCNQPRQHQSIEPQGLQQDPLAQQQYEHVKTEHSNKIQDSQRPHHFEHLRQPQDVPRSQNSHKQQDFKLQQQEPPIQQQESEKQRHEPQEDGDADAQRQQQDPSGHQRFDTSVDLQKGSSLPQAKHRRPEISGGPKPKIRTRSMSDIGISQHSAMYRLEREAASRETVRGGPPPGMANGEMGALDTRVSVAQLRHSYLENANRKPEL